MKKLFWLALALGVSVHSAKAHSPVPGIGEFYNGMLHPFLVPSQLLALLALGLVMGQHAPKSSSHALPAFFLMLLAALYVPTPPLPEVTLLYLALLCGILAVLAFDTGSVGPAIYAAAIAALIGNNVNADIPLGRSPWLLLAGSALGVTLVLILFGGLAALLRNFRNGIVLRVLGSWTAAVAVMIIALSFVSERTDI